MSSVDNGQKTLSGDLSMKQYGLIVLVCLMISLFAAATQDLGACTSLLVTKDATEDGSVIITYTTKNIGINLK